MKLRTATLAMLLLAAHCGNSGSKINPADVPDSSYCDEMCEQLRSLNCAEGEDYYDSDLPGEVGVPNATCEHFCTTQQDNGVFVNPRCVMTVPSCDVIEEYRQMDCSD